MDSIQKKLGKMERENKSAAKIAIKDRILGKYKITKLRQVRLMNDLMGQGLLKIGEWEDTYRKPMDIERKPERPVAPPYPKLGWDKPLDDFLIEIAHYVGNSGDIEGNENRVFLAGDIRNAVGKPTTIDEMKQLDYWKGLNPELRKYLRKFEEVMDGMSPDDAKKLLESPNGAKTLNWSQRRILKKLMDHKGDLSLGDLGEYLVGIDYSCRLDISKKDLTKEQRKYLRQIKKDGMRWNQYGIRMSPENMNSIIRSNQYENLDDMIAKIDEAIYPHLLAEKIKNISEEGVIAMKMSSLADKNTPSNNSITGSLLTFTDKILKDLYSFRKKKYMENKRNEEENGRLKERRAEIIEGIYNDLDTGMNKLSERKREEYKALAKRITERVEKYVRSAEDPSITGFILNEISESKMYDKDIEEAKKGIEGLEKYERKRISAREMGESPVVAEAEIRANKSVELEKYKEAKFKGDVPLFSNQPWKYDPNAYDILHVLDSYDRTTRISSALEHIMTAA